MKRISYAIMCALLVLWASAACAAPVVLKCGLVAAPETTQVRELREWARLVKERTGGAVEIEVYPAEQLGNERALLENTNLGTIDCSLIGPSGAERLTPEFGIFENAYTFQSTDHIGKSVMNVEFVNYLSAILEAKSNMKLLGFQWFGHRHVIAEKPILTPEDGAGLKIRTPDVPSYRVACQAMGATATPMAYGEVYMGLSQGVVDAAECPLENINVMKWYEVRKELTLTSHVEGITCVFINKNSFEKKLTPEQQKIVFDTGMEVWNTFFKDYQKTEEEMLENLKGQGVTVHALTPEQSQVFITRAQELLAKDAIPQWGETWTKFLGYAK